MTLIAVDRIFCCIVWPVHMGAGIVFDGKSRFDMPQGNRPQLTPDFTLKCTVTVGVVTFRVVQQQTERIMPVRMDLAVMHMHIVTHTFEWWRLLEAIESMFVFRFHRSESETFIEFRCSVNNAWFVALHNSSDTNCYAKIQQKIRKMTKNWFVNGKWRQIQQDPLVGRVFFCALRKTR